MACTKADRMSRSTARFSAGTERILPQPHGVIFQKSDRSVISAVSVHGSGWKEFVWLRARQGTQDSSPDGNYQSKS